MNSDLTGSSGSSRRKGGWRETIRPLAEVVGWLSPPVDVQQLRAEHDLPPMDPQRISASVSNGARALVRLGLDLPYEAPEFENKRQRLLALYSEVLGTAAAGRLAVAARKDLVGRITRLLWIDADRFKTALEEIAEQRNIETLLGERARRVELSVEELFDD